MKFWEKLNSLIQTFPESSHRETFEKVKKEDMGFIALCLSPIGFVVAGIFFLKYRAPISTIILFSHMILLVIFGLVRRTQIPASIYQNFVIFLYYSLFTCLTWTTGGFKSQDLFWLPALSIVAGSFVSRKASLIWSVISFLTISLFFSGLIDPFIVNEITPGDSKHYLFVSSVSMIMVLTMISFLSETNRIFLSIEKEDALQAANRTANLASLGEVAGGIAHEINNPLMIISGSAMIIEKALNKETIDREKVTKHTSTIRKTSKRAAVIIKGLKTLSRDGEFDPKETCTLGEIFEEVLTFLSSKMRNQEIELQFNDQNQILNRPVSLYRVQFSQVILNLVKNSIEAIDEMAPKDKWIRIEVEENSKSELVLSISDSGPGIPEAIQQKMFTPFFTTKPLGVGTGLGLPLCFSIIEKSGGSLAYDNTSSNTIFRITFPKEAIHPCDEKKAA